MLNRAHISELCSIQTVYYLMIFVRARRTFIVNDVVVIIILFIVVIKIDIIHIDFIIFLKPCIQAIPVLFY